MNENELATSKQMNLIETLRKQLNYEANIQYDVSKTGANLIIKNLIAEINNGDKETKSGFKYIKEEGGIDFVQLEIAYQLKRIADSLNKS